MSTNSPLKDEYTKLTPDFFSATLKSREAQEDKLQALKLIFCHYHPRLLDTEKITFKINGN